MKRDSRQILTELLVLQSQAGDEQAFRDLHDLWQGDVLRMAAVRMGDPAAGREVAQDTWVAIAKGLGRLTDPACFPRWALQIVQRRAADAIRRKQRDRSHVQSLHAAAQSQPVALHPERPEVARLAEALSGLTGDERTLLDLFYQVGRSVAEIAEILDVPVGTVKSRLHHVRDRLRTQINQESS